MPVLEVDFLEPNKKNGKKRNFLMTLFTHKFRISMCVTLDLIYNPADCLETCQTKTKFIQTPNIELVVHSFTMSIQSY